MQNVTPAGTVSTIAERVRKQAKYRADPVAWMKEKLGRVMWSKPMEIARSVAANRFTAVHSCHGIGKSFTAADICAWWIAAPANSLTAIKL